MEPKVAFYLIPAVLILIGIRKLRERSWGYCKNHVQLDNKVAIVTGANSGIGYEIAKELAARNAHVILACRNMEAAKEAVLKIQKQLGGSRNLIAMELDLSSLRNVQQFARSVQELCPQVHILVNNAGVAYPNEQTRRTLDGLEEHFGVNYLGHFYLTNLLLKTMEKSAPSRIIILASSLHKRGEIDLDNLNATKWNPKRKLYANSKLASMFFCRELAKRVQNGVVNVYAACPGWVYTGLFRHSIAWYHYILATPIAFFFLRTPKQGAQTPIFCATEPSLASESGFFYRDCKRYESIVKFDDRMGRLLWDKSLRIIEEKIG